jgi:hypothetical protein
MAFLNNKIQCLSAEFLHYVLSRSADAIDLPSLAAIQDAVLQRLLYCVWHKRLDIQSKLLSLHHVTLQLLERQPVDVGFSYSLDTKHYSIEASEEQLHTNSSIQNTIQIDACGESFTVITCTLVDLIGPCHPLFVKVLLEGMSCMSNRPVLPYYMDFILSSLPFLRKSFRTVLVPIIHCTCDQLLEFAKRLEQSYGKDVKERNRPIDMEGLLMIAGLEKMVLYSHAEAKWDDKGDVKRPLDSSGYGIRGITDLVTGVFVGDSGSDTFTPEQKAKEVLLSHFPEIIAILCRIWEQTVNIASREGEKKVDGKDVVVPSMQMAASLVTLTSATTLEENVNLSSSIDRLQHRIKKMIDSFFRISPAETVEAVVQCWTEANSSMIELEVLFVKDFLLKLILFSEAHDRDR